MFQCRRLICGLENKKIAELSIVITLVDERIYALNVGLNKDGIIAYA